MFSFQDTPFYMYFNFGKIEAKLLNDIVYVRMTISDINGTDVVEKLIQIPKF